MRNIGKTYSFTLVEIVIVLAVLSLLLLLAHSALKAAVDDITPETKCLGNLKKLYQVFVTYAHDYNDSLPVKINKSKGRTPWIYVLAKTYPKQFTGKLWSKPYGRRFWHCPACPLNNWKDSCSGGASDYGLNALAFVAPGKKATVKLKDSAPDPKDKFLLADAPLTGYRPYLHPTKYLSISNRHNLKGNYIFFDGHTDSFTRREVFRWGENDSSAFDRSADQKPWNCDL